MNNDTQSLLELRKFVAPEFIFGLGARKLVGRYAKNCGARKVLLVTDKFLREEHQGRFAAVLGAKGAHDSAGALPAQAVAAIAAKQL